MGSREIKKYRRYKTKFELVNNYQYRGRWNGKWTWLWWYAGKVDFFGGLNITAGIFGIGLFFYHPNWCKFN